MRSFLTAGTLLLPLLVLMSEPSSAAPLKRSAAGTVGAPVQSAGSSQPSGNLEMIQLQSLMSQRQQALQIATNLLKAQSSSARTVIGNIGK